jgi:exosome complex component RRP41
MTAMDTSSSSKSKKSTETISNYSSENIGGFDLISVEGFRQDGRKADELRHFRVSFNVVSDADGSCYLEHGNCKLLACVYGPYEGESRSNQEQAVITCDFSMTSFCVSERRLRTFGELKSQKLQMAIQRVFQQAIHTESYPKSHIDINLKLIQADGNDYCPCVNAATLALINAGRKLVYM